MLLRDMLAIIHVVFVGTRKFSYTVEHSPAKATANFVCQLYLVAMLYWLSYYRLLLGYVISTL